MRGQGKGWITADILCCLELRHKEYTRINKGKVTGRTMEIHRLIGRALRSVVDLEKVGEKPFGLIVMLFKQMAEQEQHRLQVHLWLWF